MTDYANELKELEESWEFWKTYNVVPEELERIKKRLKEIADDLNVEYCDPK